MFKSVGIANGSLTEQLLKFAAVVEGSLHFGHEFIGYIDRDSSPLRSDIQEMARVAFTFQTGFAPLTHAGAPPQGQRAQSYRPKIRGLILEPLLNFLSRFFGGLHNVRIPYKIRTVNMFLINLAVRNIYEFRDRN